MHEAFLAEIRSLLGSETKETAAVEKVLAQARAALDHTEERAKHHL